MKTLPREATYRNPVEAFLKLKKNHSEWWKKSDRGEANLSSVPIDPCRLCGRELVALVARLPVAAVTDWRFIRAPSHVTRRDDPIQQGSGGQDEPSNIANCVLGHGERLCGATFFGNL